MAKGGHAYLRLRQLAETRDSGQIHRNAMFIAATYNGELSRSRVAPDFGVGQAQRRPLKNHL